MMQKKNVLLMQITNFRVVLLCHVALLGCHDMQRGIVPPAPPKTLQDAIYRKDYVQFRKLLPAHAAELNVLGPTGGLLHSSAALGDSDAVRALLEAGAEVNLKMDDAKTPLHRAKTGVVVRELIKGKAQIEAKTETLGWTPLHIAARLGTCEVVSELLKAGADPNSRDKNNCTPLMGVIESKNGRTALEIECIIRELVQAGANIDVVSQPLRKSALYLAAEYGNDWEVVLLLSLGADVNQHDPLNASGVLGAVMWSATSHGRRRTDEQRLETCRILVEKGISRELMCRAIAGFNPTRDPQNVKIVEYLRERLSKSEEPAAMP